MSEGINVVSQRQIHVVGGGTLTPVAPHLQLASRAYGQTARRIAELCGTFWTGMGVNLHLTKMADPSSSVESVNDLHELALDIVHDFDTKIVFWTPAVVDWEVKGGTFDEKFVSSEPYFDLFLPLQPSAKILHMFRKLSVDSMAPRKDIFLVAFKATSGLSSQDQYQAALKVLKASSANLVLANDTVTRQNMIVTPEEAYYGPWTERETALRELLDMTYLRSQLTFTRSTVIAGEPVPWDDERIYPALRSVVNWCIERGAYKPFMGVTAGHFAAQIDEDTFLSSRRKTNFNNLPSTGLVQVRTDGPDTVVSLGSRPSVGGQSQRIVFKDHPNEDCIVHFHCPILPNSKVPVVSQREFECGSHECGANTSNGLEEVVPGIKAVYLDNHGPNIVFHHSIDPASVKGFITSNFDLSAKTGGYVS
jgi:hypothetical protein